MKERTKGKIWFTVVVTAVLIINFDTWDNWPAIAGSIATLAIVWFDKFVLGLFGIEVDNDD